MFAGLVVAASLAACSGGGDDTPEVPPGDTTVNEEPALVTGEGTPVGDAVVASIGSTGGMSTAGGVGVSVPDGAFTGAEALTLQPTTNPVEDGAAALKISSTGAWSKPLTVSFPIAADEDDADNLGLAVMQTDGTWRELRPVTVDRAKGTISAALPWDANARAASSSAPEAIGKARAWSLAPPPPPPDWRVVVRFWRFFLRPATATVKVNGTRSFVPFARVQSRILESTQVVEPDPDEELVPLAPLTPHYPFLNDKPGFARHWSVDDKSGGDSVVGTIAPTFPSGATYSAPARKPSPDTVRVTFTSVNQAHPNQRVSRSATVRIVEDVIQTYAGTVDFEGTFGDLHYVGSTPVTWRLTEHLPNDLAKYEMSERVQVTVTRPDCRPVSGSVNTTGSMIVMDPVRGGPSDPFARKHWFAFGPSENVFVATSCGDPPHPEEVPLVLMPTTHCVSEPSATMLSYDDIATLSGSGTWTCVGNSSTVKFSFTAQ